MIEGWFIDNLACPVDQQRLELGDRSLRCPSGHAFPIVDGVPVMLVAGGDQTIDLATASLARAWSGTADPRAPELYLESLGISEAEKQGVLALARRDGPVDAVVVYLVAATNGMMYRHLIGSLDRYPIPDLPLPTGAGRRLLDVGCSWGRWTLAAAARGYQAVGIDPSLGAVMAAKRVAQRLGASCRFLVGDARHLPFRAGAFDAVYSYSVIQHFSRADARQAVTEAARVVAPGGIVKIQMPTRFGMRCLLHQLRRGFRDGRGFEVRYWSIPGLRKLFGEIGPARISADCYFGIGLQRSDRALMTSSLAFVLDVSEALKAASRALPALVWSADSVFAEATRTKGPHP